MSETTRVSVLIDTAAATLAMAGMERAVRFVHLQAELSKLTDKEWRTLRDAEDRRRGRAREV